MAQRFTDRSIGILKWMRREIDRLRQQIRRQRWPYNLPDRLIDIQLAENHPGRGKYMDVWLGTWDRANDQPTYDTDVKYKAVDWRKLTTGLELPDKCATGLAVWRPSTTHGRVLYVVDLDCEAAGEATEYGYDPDQGYGYYLCEDVFGGADE